MSEEYAILDSIDFDTDCKNKERIKDLVKKGLEYEKINSCPFCGGACSASIKKLLEHKGIKETGHKLIRKIPAKKNRGGS